MIVVSPQLVLPEHNVFIVYITLWCYHYLVMNANIVLFKYYSNKRVSAVGMHSGRLLMVDTWDYGQIPGWL